jgi:hypothetical protein
MTTPQTVAEWLIEKIRAEGTLHEEEASYLLDKQFGSEWVHVDVTGRMAVSQDVLKRLRQIHGGTIQWDNSARCWSVL